KEVRVFDVARTANLPDYIEFIQGDMRNLSDVERAMDGIDVVMHLAFVQSLSKRPLREKYGVNIYGTENFLREALKRKVKRFVHTSTIEIYGVHPPYPCYEDAPTDNPTGWYGRHKLECEKLCLKYHDLGLPATMLRMPAICGPGHYNHGPFLDLMDRIIENKPVAMIDDGKIYGNMTHYKDVINAYLSAAEKEEAIGEAFNIASEKPATHIQILRAMMEQVDSRSIVISIPRKSFEALYFIGSILGIINVPEHQAGYALYHNHYAIDKAKEKLGYEPKHTVLDSAREQIESYLQNREAVRERNKSY
ncbi:MAG: NAD(P)-dependent oxidoreductase, partial [bacterium]